MADNTKTVQINEADLEALIRMAREDLELNYNTIKRGAEEMGLTQSEYQDVCDQYNNDMFSITRAALALQMLSVEEHVRHYISDVLDTEDPLELLNVEPQIRLIDFSDYTGGYAK